MKILFNNEKIDENEIVVEIYDENDEKIDNDLYIKEIKEILLEIIKENNVDFINIFEDLIDEIDEINDDNYEIINKVENNIVKIYHKMKYYNISSLKYYRKYFIKSYYIDVFDLKYFLKYKINNLTLKKYQQFYQYKRVIKSLKYLLNITDEDVDQLIRHHIINIEENYIIVNNVKYDYIYVESNYLTDKDDLIEDLNRKYYQMINKSFNYHIINFDEIDISSLNYFYNLYSYNYNVVDKILENIDVDLNEDYNKDLLNYYNLDIYTLYNEDNIDDLYDEIYDILFNEILVDEDVIDTSNLKYINKCILINKKYLQGLNDKNDNCIYYMSYYSNKIEYNYNKLFEIILKEINDVDKYYDLIDIVDENVYNNYDLILDDFNKMKFNININNSTDLYFYVKYHYNINLKKDDLILYC